MKLQYRFRHRTPTEGGHAESKTIYYRVFKYFAAFSVVILMILWTLQIFFLQTFYQQMKIQELYNAADTIEASADEGVDALLDTIFNLSAKSDMYIDIQQGSSSATLFDSGDESTSFMGNRMYQFAQRYDTSILKAKLSGNVKSVVAKQTVGPGKTETMIYASILSTSLLTGENIYLFIYAPLTPVGTTVNILAEMLIIVTIMSLLIGLAMSLIISRRLARPLNSITDSAAQLAEGRYDIRFEGTGYAETEELAATLNYAAEELSKSDKLQKDLVANVSHDLKTPLTMVKSYAEMIRDLSGDNPEKRKKHLQVIINEADRLNLLVNDLTSLSKMQAGVDAVNLEPADLKTVASEAIESFSLHAEQDGFRFSLEAEGNTVVPMDEKKIHQVFSNLIGNAIRYSSENKEVTVRITEKEDCVRCEVIDRGQGIRSEDLESIWDRYYQSSSNHSRTSNGSGLGLSIVKQIFVLHGAAYGVESEENRGSNFWFELKKEIPEPRKGRKKSAGRQNGRTAAADSTRADERTAAADSAWTDERTQDERSQNGEPQDDPSQDEQSADADRGNRIPRTTEDGGQEEIH